MSKKLTILVDMDGIVANLLEKWLGAYNKEWDDKLTPDDIMTWDTHLYVKPECRKRIYNYFTPELFLGLRPIEGAVEALMKWKQEGHRVFIVSAPPWGCADAKYTWARQHLPFLSSREINMVHAKYLVNGDIFIDDSPNNIRQYREHHPESKIFTIAYRYNKEVEDLVDIRAGSWKDRKSAWGTFIEEVDKISK